MKHKIFYAITDINIKLRELGEEIKKLEGMIWETNIMQNGEEQPTKKVKTEK